MIRSVGTRHRVRRLAALLLLFCLLTAARVAGAVSWYPAGPQGSVGVRSFTIGQQIFLGPGEQILGAQMWLDGHRVEPVWDTSGLVRYTPTQPLEPGRHTVQLSVDVLPALQNFLYDPIASEFSFTVSPEAVDQPPAPGPEEQRALEVVNRYRKQAGVAPLTYSQALGAAAAGHARYLADHADQQAAGPHREVPAASLFTGETAQDRAWFMGYVGSPTEVINFTDRAEAAVDGWMDTLYHRIPLLHPGNSALGYGVAGRPGDLVNVAMAGPGDETRGAVLWPYPGQTDVPTGWDGSERPDPMALYPGARKPVGYTVTLTFGGPVRSLSLRSGTLTGPDGQVPVMTFQPKFDPNLTDTVALIPKAPLAPNTTYEVHLTGRVDLGGGAVTFDRTWSFTTRAEQRPQLKEATTETLDGVVSAVDVTGTGLEPGLRLFLGGLPVAGLSVAPGGISFAPPRGYTGDGADLLLVTPGGQEVLWPRFVSGKEAYRFPDSGAAFTELPLTVNGQEWAVPALRHSSSGAVMVPAGVLAELGARRTAVPVLGRTYWQLGAVSGDYTLGRTAAARDGRPFNLALPVRQVGAEIYVDGTFVQRLAGWGYHEQAGRVSIGISDIAGSPARPQIVRLLQAGVITGTGDGRFRPDEPISRAAFVTMLTRSRSLSPLPGDTAGFADTAGHWVATQGYIGAAVKAGLLLPGDYPGGRFEPDRPISRAEMAAMVTRALGTSGPSPEGPASGPATRAEAAVIIAGMFQE